jgi:hypothetical protein
MRRWRSHEDRNLSADARRRLKQVEEHGLGLMIYDDAYRAPGR